MLASVRLALRAPEQVRTTLLALADEPASLPIYAALVERIALLRDDPGGPRGRGLVRRMEPSGTLVRVATVFVPDLRETWAIVWTLSSDDKGDAVELRLVERIEHSG